MRVLLFALIVVLAGVVAFVGWEYVLPAFPPGPAEGRGGHTWSTPVGDIAEARRTIDSVLHETPAVASFFDKLRNSFASDYVRDVDAFAAQASASGLVESPEVYLTDAYRMLRQTRGVLAAKAGTGALTRVFATQAAVVTALGGTDPHLCVDFLYGGATPAYFAFAAEHSSLIADMATADLDAILDGQNKQIHRPKPSEADFQNWEQALRAKGLNPVEIGILVDGKLPDPPIEDARLCALSQIKTATLDSLPEDQRLRIDALAIELMARS